MNLRQLRYLREVIDRDFNITTAAGALYTSQPGVSKQLLLLERELGVELLLRRGNRIAGLTEPGKQIAEIARRMLLDAESLRRVGEEFGTQDTGRLVVGTTHTHARYVLPDVIRRFTARYPHIQLVIRQENENHATNRVSTGGADIAVSAASSEPHHELLTLPCYRLPRSVIVPPGHPLLREKRLTLERIARYPIITLDTSFTGGKKVMQAFAGKGLSPTVVMSAIDSDVIKSYVELGLGIAVLPTIAFVPKRDRGLRAVDASHLFEPTIACIHLRRNNYIRRYMFDFIQILAPQWSQTAIDQALKSGEVPARQLAIYPTATRPARPAE